MIGIVLWLIYVPQFRNIYFLNFLFFFLITFPLYKKNITLLKRKVTIFIIMICFISSTLNANRIYSEYNSTKDIYSLKKNFPWPYLPHPIIFKKNKSTKINEVDIKIGSCWNTEPFCNYFQKKIKRKELENKKIILIN